MKKSFLGLEEATVPSFTDEDIKAIVSDDEKYVSEEEIDRWERAMGGFHEEMFGALARQTLGYMEAEGRLLPAGGIETIEWGVRDLDGTKWFTGEVEARGYADTVTGPLAVVTRTRTEWSDGSCYLGAWDEIPSKACTGAPCPPFEDAQLEVVGQLDD